MQLKSMTKQGFTLIETIITLSIMASVTAASYPYVIKNLQKNAANKIAGEINKINEGAQNYYARTNKWPDQGLTNCQNAISVLLGSGDIPATIPTSGLISGGRTVVTKCDPPNYRFVIGVISSSNSNYQETVNDMVKSTTPSWTNDNPDTTGTESDHGTFYTTTLKPHEAARDDDLLSNHIGDLVSPNADTVRARLNIVEPQATAAKSTAESAQTDATLALTSKAETNGSSTEDFVVQGLTVATIDNRVNILGESPFVTLKENDVVNNPQWWWGADGGTFSLRLNNTGTYPIHVKTNATNDAVSEIELGYPLSVPTINGVTINTGAGAGGSNLAIGSNALAANTIGQKNTASGSNALAANTIGQKNTASGSNALAANEGGNLNTASGSYALAANKGGSTNSAFGSHALAANVGGKDNTATGFNALAANTGDNNTASGSNALAANTGGKDNTATGLASLLSNTTGGSNVATGVGALMSNTTGGSNVATGMGSLFTNLTGIENVALGYFAGHKSTGSGNIFIGHKAGHNEVESNKLYIDNSITTTPLIHGDFSTNKVTINDNLEAKGAIAATNLTVNGTFAAAWDSGLRLKRQTDGTGVGDAAIVVDSQGMKLKTLLSGDAFYFRNSDNNTRLLIADNGNVGINTTAPTEKLEVNGNIKAKKIFIDDGSGGSTEVGGPGDDGKGWTGGTYAIATGKVTFASDDGLGFTTDDLRGADADVDTFVQKSGDTMTGTLNIFNQTNTNSNIELKPQTSTKGSFIDITAGDGTDYGLRLVKWSKAGAAYITTKTSTMKIRTVNTDAITIDTDQNTTFHGNITVSSDERLKSNIKPLEDSLSKLMNIRGVSYVKKASNQPEIGVIAQEVEKQYPELIRNRDDGMKTVNYNGLIGVLIESVKQLSSEIDILKAETHRLRQEVKVLNQRR